MTDALAASPSASVGTQEIPQIAATNGLVQVSGDPAALLRANFVRAGDDLTIVGPEGPIAQVAGYFVSGDPADLAIGGAVLPGHTVAILARESIGRHVAHRPDPNDAHLRDGASDDDPDSAPEANAFGDAVSHPADADLAPDPLSAPVAVVEGMTGEAWVIRFDGSRVALEIGLPIHQEDTVVTGQQGTVGLRFTDGMAFSLGDDARMVLEEFRYDPDTGDGGGLISVVQGAFSFVSGQAAKAAEDALQIEMPTMTIGVRGTKVAGFAAAEGEASRVALLAEDDGTVGKIMVSTEAGRYLVTDANFMVESLSRHSEPQEPVRITSDVMHDYFSSALKILPSAAPKPDQANDLPEVDVDSPHDVPDDVDARAYKEFTEGKKLSRTDEPEIGEAEPTVALVSPDPVPEPETVAEAAETAAVADDPEPVLDDEDADPFPDIDLPDIDVPDVAPDEPVEPVNAAPGLDASASPSLAPVGEDAAAPAGDTVASIIVDGSITDADGAVEAIAVTGVDDTNGTWQFSTDGGATFVAFGAVSETGALLLDGSALVRFVPVADFNGTADFTFKAWDQSSGSSGQGGVDTTAGTAFSAATDTASITVTPVDDAPVIDTGRSPAMTAIAEDSGASGGDTVASIVPDGSITDPDGVIAEAIAVTAADTANGAWEYSTDGGASFTDVGAVSDTAALLLDGGALIRFVPNADYNGTAGFAYKAWDQSVGTTGDTGVDTTAGTAFSVATETASVTVDPVNDAPVLDTAGAPTLAPVAEDAAAPAGTIVSTLVVDGSITDVDGAVEAIAVTGVDDANGSWQYSLDDGATYTGIGVVSDTTALLLDGNALIRFVPNPDYNGSATLTYKAWDMSSGATGQSGIDTTIGSAFSAAAETATVTVNPVNDAPVLDTAGTPTLTAIAEDTAAPVGDTVASIVIDGSITDSDGAVEAIAVTGVDDANGTWEYSTDGGSTFTAFGGVTANAAVLLDATALVRFVPDAAYNGTATFSYKAWDQSSGANGDTAVDTTTGTAFSAATGTGSITIDPLNNAPVLDTGGAPGLTAIAEDATAPTGDTVASIVIDGSITDPDGAVEAIAVTGVDDANGTWEYSTDGGTTFTAFGAVTETTAVLLDASALIRFVPDADYNGSATFSYKAWDKSSGFDGQTGVDATAGSAFSIATETASITINPVNDAPDLHSAGTPTLTAIAEDTAAPAGDTVASIVIDGSITDVDGAVEAIAVTGVDDTNGTWEYSTDGGATFSAIGGASPNAAVLLDAAALIRFVPDADYNGPASFSYKAWDQSSGASGDSGVDTTAGTAFSAAAMTGWITVDPVNDAPVLDTTGTPQMSSIAADATAPAGDTVASIVIDGSISDVDGAVEAIAVVGVDTANGSWEYSLDGGSTFSAIGSASETSALLLDGAAVIRFVPDPGFGGTASFTFKAWDGSSGASGDGAVDTTLGTAFSSAVDTTYISVGQSVDVDFTSGSEFIVNSETANEQESPDVAALSDGGYVVVWQSKNQDGHNNGVFGQRYDADGSAVGDEFQVNTETFNNQEDPAVAGLDGGGFVVVWASHLQDGHNNGVFGQRFDDQGNPTGGEFQVNTETFNKQENADVASLDGGGFVVIWESENQDGGSKGVYGQRYDSSGATAGSEFQVNTTTAEDQQDAQVVGLADGGFFVVWKSDNQDGNGYGVFGQRFDATGTAIGGEVQVNTTATEDQMEPAIAVLDDGGFVIAWNSNGQDGSGEGIIAQRFDAAGNRVESEFVVNSTTNGDQSDPSITALADGGFLIAWQTPNEDGSDYGVYAQRFNADGDAVGSEFRINTTTDDAQANPALVSLSHGDVVAVWESTNQDGSNTGIVARQFEADAASVGNAAPVVAGAYALDFGGTNSYVDLGNNFDPGTGDLTVEAWFHYDGSAGFQSIVGKGGSLSSDDGFRIFIEDGTLVVRSSTNLFGGEEAYAASQIALGNTGWHHVALVIDQESGTNASSITGYLNGSSAGWTHGQGFAADNVFTTSGDGIVNYLDPFLIGADNDLFGKEDFHQSQIADVRVWSTARSEAEIQADMGRTLNGDEANLIANWRLDDGAGSNATNAVSGGVDGTIVGGPSWNATDNFTIAMNDTLDGRVTATDADGDALSFGVSTDAANGTASIDAATGVWAYTPDTDYVGADTFSYQITDGTDTDVVTISVNIT